MRTRFWTTACFGFIIFTASMAAGTPPSPVKLVDDTALREKYEKEQPKRLEQGMFKELDAEADRLRTTWEQFPGGLPKLMLFYSGFRTAIDARAPKVPRNDKKYDAAMVPLNQLLAHGEKWVETNPSSATAKIVLAYMYYHANRHVPDPETRETRWTKIWELVDTAQKSGVKDPAIYHLLILKIRKDRADIKDMEALVDKSIAIHPTYFATIMEVAHALYPGYGHEPVAWVQYAERMTEKTRHTEGDGMYARLFWGMMQNFTPWHTFRPDTELYRRNSLSWPRIRQGFRDMNERYPGSQRLLNYFAFYACLAQDWTTAHEIFGMIGDKWDKDVWYHYRKYKQWRDTASPSTQDFQREPWGQISGVTEGISRCIAFSPSGKTLTIGNDKGKVLLWDMEEQRVHSQWRAHTNLVMALTFSPDGRTLATGAGHYKDRVNGMVKLWDVNLRNEIDSIPTGIESVDGLDFSSDGKWLAIAAAVPYSASGTLYVRNLADKTNVPLLAKKCRAISCAFSPTKPSLLAFGCWHQLQLWDVAANQPIARDIPIPELPDQDASSDPNLTKCDACLYLNNMTFNSTGDLLALARPPTWEKREYAGRATLFDPHNLKQTEVQPRGDMGGIVDVAFTPDDKYLIGGGYDTYVRIWEVKTGKPVTQLYGHTDYIVAMAVSPDGRFLATAAMDHIIRLWDLHAILKKVTAQPAQLPLNH